MVRKIGGGGVFLTNQGFEYFYASLANIFNKCYKKTVFMKNN